MQIRDQPRNLVLQDIHLSSMYVFQVLDFYHMCYFKSMNGCKCKLFMASRANNMIIFAIDYGVGTCNDNVDNISFSALGVNTLCRNPNLERV